MWAQKKGNDYIEHGNYHHGKAPVLQVDVKHLDPVESLEFPAIIAYVASFYLYHLPVLKEIVSSGRNQWYIHNAQETVTDGAIMWQIKFGAKASK